MEAAELDVQLEELEIRLERLRALYEQYFLGIEKLEPAVARKDVDRRIYVLRREKIRNTGKRFKLQTIIQRYNTFQQYWHRICREIENGTYKRHVLRAERSFGPSDLLTIAARKRFGREKEAAKASAPPPEPAQPAPATASPSPPPPAAASPSPPPPRAAAAPPPPPRAAAAPSPPPPRAAAAVPPPPPAAAAPPPARRVSAKPQQFESLDLDMDFLGDWDPSAKRAPAAARPPEPAKRSEPPPRAPAPAVAKSAPPPPPAAPAPAPTRSAPPAPIPVRAARKPLPRAEPRPEPRAEARPEPKAEPKPKPAAAAAAALDEARIRDLHGRLNELKRKNQEAGQVSLEGLAKSLRATEEKLRQQHAGRRIDFDVVVKDGRAVVKPIVR